MAQAPGKQLKQIRESRGISLEEISQKTRIRLAYLEGIESGETEALPSRTQLRGFLRLYASELGVEFEDLQLSDTHDAEKPQPIKTAPNAQVSDPLLPDSTDAVLTHDESEPEPDSAQEVASDLIDTELSSIELTQPTDTEDLQDSSAVFVMIGEKLKNRRDLLSLSFDDIHTITHIRKQYVKAIEAGLFNQLPSPTQAKGMLSNYAEFLNLDVESFLLSYADGLQMQRIEKQQGLPKGTSSAKELSRASLRLKNFFSLDLLVIASLFIGFAIFVIWGVNRILAVDSPGTLSTELPEVADILLATSSPTPQLTVSPDATSLAEGSDNSSQGEESPLFTPALNNNPINIVIVPRQRTWVQITSDSELVFEGRLLPGNAYDFSGQEAVEILTGNAGALQIYFNDQDIGSPGLIGQVVNLIFTETGLVRPTPTNTPTITETPLTTPSPTMTPSPTPTPTDNNG